MRWEQQRNNWISNLVENKKDQKMGKKSSDFPVDDGADGPLA